MTEQRVKGNGLIWFSFILLVIMIIGAGLVAYVWQTWQMKQLNNNLLAINQLAKASQLQNTTLATRVTNLEQEVVADKQQINTLLANNNAVGIYQINELVSIANQQLLLYANVRGALNVLTYTSELLTNNNQANLVGLKLALAKDINKLQNESSTDTTVIVASLDNLSHNLANIPLITELSNAEEPIVQQDANNKWQQVYTNIIDKLLSLVRITPVASNTKELVLLPNAEALVRQNINLQLLNAKLALFAHNQKAYIDSINKLKHYLITYLQPGNMATVSENTLNDLAAHDIDVTDLNINNTLDALSSISK